MSNQTLPSECCFAGSKIDTQTDLCTISVAETTPRNSIEHLDAETDAVRFGIVPAVSGRGRCGVA